MRKEELKRFNDAIHERMRLMGFEATIPASPHEWEAPSRFNCPIRVSFASSSVDDSPIVFCRFDRPRGLVGSRTYGDIVEVLGNVNPYTGKYNEYASGARTAEEAWAIIENHIKRAIPQTPREATVVLCMSFAQLAALEALLFGDVEERTAPGGVWDRSDSDRAVEVIREKIAQTMQGGIRHEQPRSEAPTPKPRRVRPSKDR